MNHAGEITPADQNGAPARGDRDHRRSRPSGALRRRRGRSPTPRPRSSRVSSPAAPRCSTATTRSSTVWLRRPSRWRRAVIAFGHGDHCDARLRVDRRRWRPLESQPASAGGGRPSASAAAGVAYGAECARRRCCCWIALGVRPRDRHCRPGALERARRAAAPAHSRSRAGDALLIDESYNANPASMRAALAALGERSADGLAAGSPCSATCWNWARLPRLHAGSARAVDAAGVDLVFCVRTAHAVAC